MIDDFKNLGQCNSKEVKKRLEKNKCNKNIIGLIDKIGKKLQGKKKLCFDFKPYRMEGLGSTNGGYITKICININVSEMGEKDFLPVLIHELYEALYIAEGLPYVTDDQDDRSQLNEITMLFSHNYLNKKPKNWYLRRILKKGSKDLCNVREKKYIEREQIYGKWYMIVSIAGDWIANQLYRKKLRVMSSYLENKDVINTIIKIVRRTKYNDKVSIKKSMKKVIEVLKEEGLNRNTKVRCY